MRRIKKFEPLSVMRISALCYGVLGFLEGAIFSLVFSMVPLAPTAEQPMPHWVGPLFGGLSIVIFPVLFAALGAVVGGLGAVIYNVSARFVGGIQVEVE